MLEWRPPEVARLAIRTCSTYHPSMELSAAESEYLESEVEIALEPYRALLSEADLAWMRSTLRAKLFEDRSLREEALAVAPREDLGKSEVKRAPEIGRAPSQRRKPKAG